MNLTMPKLDIVFTAAAQAAVSRIDQRVVLLILRDSVLGGKSYTLLSASDIPSETSGNATVTLSETNKAQIEQCFMGYINAPAKVLLYVIDDSTNAKLANALAWAATQKFDVLCGPADVSAAECATIATWVKTQRANAGAHCVAVLPNYVGDDKAIINFAGEGLKKGSSAVTTAAYCSRIAGLLAGTPLNISATYAPLAELTDCTRKTTAELDAAIAAGKLCTWYDGTRVRLARAVNSLTTTSDLVGDEMKKIKIVGIVDLIDEDLRQLITDSYIGLRPNTYDNKIVLLAAIRSYLQTMEDTELIDEGWSVDIDVEATKTYLRSQGVEVAKLSTQQIRESNTGTSVFYCGSIRPLDAIEDVSLTISL